ncbi:class I SAM-dependent methyltransferase [Oscillochloris sp. ZM17-4]|uniref:class I SAM-dependent methyltransferase n=1 Tax=Oscillochloris sp. ZM17-4 TaxID=2866714 RepID=UPI001C73406D|nr:class I SAM-dependent methyltransferase [Oscillochloris sp. ZM17-4]MBX0328656.1 class I SAM-dependent methyltransferase [Oscillochloris sp. ZM17-4]
MAQRFQDQFGNPQGLGGRLAGWLMALTNRDLNTWAVDQLAVRPGDHVLEIGFGPGLAVQALARRARNGQVDGIDVSPLMVEQAARRNAAMVKAGRVRLQIGSASALPFDAARFDRVLAVNNVQFWPSLADDLREVARVMRPGGTLAIVLQPRQAPSAADVLAVRDDLAAQFAAVGYRRVRSAVAPGSPMPAFAVLGERPASTM